MIVYLYTAQLGADTRSPDTESSALSSADSRQLGLLLASAV